MDNSTLDLIFPAGDGKEVVSRNDGGDITSDAGLLLVSLSDRKLVLIAGMSDALQNITHYTSPHYSPSFAFGWQ
jgi:hypothetical protein